MTPTHTTLRFLLVGSAARWNVRCGRTRYEPTRGIVAVKRQRTHPRATTLEVDTVRSIDRSIRQVALCIARSRACTSPYTSCAQLLIFFLCASWCGVCHCVAHERTCTCTTTTLDPRAKKRGRHASYSTLNYHSTASHRKLQVVYSTTNVSFVD